MTTSSLDAVSKAGSLCLHIEVMKCFGTQVCALWFHFFNF